MPLEIHNMAGHLLRRLHQISTSIFLDHMKRNGYNFTSVQFTILSAIGSNPDIDQAALANLTAYDRATIGGVIDRLEKKGLINRTISQLDRRAREVTLTTKGKTTLKMLIEIVQNLEEEILTDLSINEKASFLKLAAKITNRHEQF